MKQEEKQNIQNVSKESKEVETNVSSETGANAEVKTLQELLDSNKNYQSEFDTRITKATETAVTNAKVKWEQEQAEKVAESQKLANMDELQKKDYEIERLNKELAKRDADKQANDLMTEAIKQANEKGIPLDIMTALDYKNETAESIANKIAIYENAFQTQKNNIIAEYSREKAPQTGNNQVNVPNANWKYEDYAEHFKDE